ncbi:TIGR01459 family HAD-type hydrolase [Sphingomonas morindae]|uniref:TIGR01459 family HAD-type hydrolase n=1 Tax=Sphingomonas morindae TaxID=1541170 RepID=A0ABY4XBM9_9SPHN|nr:TIGR01459 family HAD-type hydrolase [Sphingomonas morindae]USI74105.1 TIGR01459 family HAD-type hydrolase [Sphingomonas morindae]
MIRLPEDARLLLCDVWGVVHDGVQAFAGARAALARWRGEGRTVVLVTNAPRPSAPIRRQLARLGVGDAHYDALVSSGDTGVELVRRAGGRAGFIGTRTDHAALTEAGLALVRDGAEALLVCTGLEEDRPDPADYDAELARMRARDTHMLCFNPDRVAYHGTTLDICAGAIAERYEALGGRVTYTGKPFAPIYERACALGAAAAGRAFAPHEVVAIGDAVATDLLGAAGMGYRFLFVTSGIERHAIAEQGEARFLADMRARHALTDFAPLAIVPALD